MSEHTTLVWWAIGSGTEDRFQPEVISLFYDLLVNRGLGDSALTFPMLILSEQYVAQIIKLVSEEVI